MSIPIYFIFIFEYIILFIALSVSSSELMIGIDSNGKNHSGICALSPGQSLTIYCPHKEEIKWGKSNIKSAPKENLVSQNNIQINHNKLFISNIDFNDSAVYFCEQKSVALRFILHVLAITKTTNVTVSTTTIVDEINGIIFNQSKLNERASANVSCSCDSGTNNTRLNIFWSGGLYDKLSDFYTIDTSNTTTGVTSTLILKKIMNNRNLYGEYICSCNVFEGAMKESKVYMQVSPIFENQTSSMRKSEGEDVILTCYVWAFPDIDNASLKWSFQNSFQLKDSIIVTRNYSNPGFSQLFIPKVTVADRGVYTCHASNSISSNSASTMLRVKSRYAALWPFIGIVIELVILIAIIVVYEWNKMQKPKESTLKCNVDSKNEPEIVGSERGNEPESLRQRLVKV